MQLSDHSFAVFVYPFCFDRARFDALVGTADRDALANAESSWQIWDRRTFPRDDLLRHVADYLNPPSEIPATACLWTLEHRVLTSPQGLGLRTGSASLCLRHRVGALGSEPADGVPDGAIPFEVSGIDLALFRVGMGYLMLRVQVSSEAPDDWYDFLNGFRFIDRPGQVDWLIRRRTGRDRAESFVPPLMEEPGGAVPAGHIQTGHLVRGLLRRLANGDQDWWREIFVPGQMLPYHALFFAGVPEAEQPLALYRLRSFFRTGQPLVPSAEDLRPDHPALLSYAKRMWFSLTLEGGGFVAFDAPDTPFWLETMPTHLREQYFLLFLFALHQRFALMNLSDQVCARWANDDVAQAEARFADLRETLLEFTARGNFNQIMQREHHHRCFRAWRAVFETERLYREVGDEVRELHGILLMRKTERIQQLAEEQQQLMEAQARAESEREKTEQARSDRLGLWFGAIAFLLGFPSLVLSYLEVDGVKDELWVTWAGLGASFLAGAFMMFALHLWLRRRGRVSTGERGNNRGGA